jgi:cupin 2 domain-containing protein
VTNIFELPDRLPPEELFEVLLAKNNIKIERIVSVGHTTPLQEWYDQVTDEWVILLQGEAELLYADNARIKLKSGDYLLIPARLKHKVIYTSSEPPCIWLAINIQV